MNRLIIYSGKFSVALFLLFIVTGCPPSPEKVKWAILEQKHQELNEKFEKLFNRSMNKQKTDLVFNDVVKNGTTHTIYLDLKPGITTSDWQEDVMNFQQELKQTHTNYQAIEVNDYRGSGFLFTPENLDIYEKSLKLFQRNLNQIKENRIADLYKTVRNADLKYEILKELFDFVKVTGFDEFKLVCYPSDDTFDYQQVVFCLNANETSKLYFSYFKANSGIVLRSIDLNDIPIRNNFPPNL